MSTRERRKLDLYIELCFAAVLTTLDLSGAKHGACELKVANLDIRASRC